MAGLFKKKKKVMAGVRVAAGVVGAAFGEGFAILHENVIFWMFWRCEDVASTWIESKLSSILAI